MYRMFRLGKPLLMQILEIRLSALSFVNYFMLINVRNRRHNTSMIAKKANLKMHTKFPEKRTFLTP